MKKMLLFFLFFPCSIFAGELHGPHTHGEMELLVVLQGNKLQISMLGSAHDLIGYERDPKTAKEKKALRKFDEKFDPFELIKINAESTCEFMQGRSESDMFSAAPHKHGLLDKTHMHELGLEGHIDFIMHYTYECKSAPEITLEIFKLTPSIKKVNVREGVIDGDVKATLTKGIIKSSSNNGDKNSIPVYFFTTFRSCFSSCNRRKWFSCRPVSPGLWT